MAERKRTKEEEGAKKEEREVEVDCGGKLGRRKKNKRECKREKGTERVKGERARERERERMRAGRDESLDNASASAPSSVALSLSFFFSLSVFSLFF